MGMQFDKSDDLGYVFNALFQPYQQRVPNVKKVTAAMIEKGMIGSQEEIVNDHVAFRTLGVPHLGVASFEKIFLHYGFRKMEHYYFAGKKLDAWWYAPPLENYPRIFISELRVKELSLKAQQIIKKYTDNIKQDPVDSLDLTDKKDVGEFFHKPLWSLPSYEDYRFLAEESEYAAWVIYNRYYLNHYTISVHFLPEPYNQLEKFNEFLEEAGVKLNSAGGKIKTSEDGLLRQSSSVAEMVKASFSDGTETLIPGSYVEFAERGVLPQFRHIPQHQLRREHLRDGFETGNADKIFESTFRSQTG